MSRDHVAVIDIGKTNAKLALVRVSDLAEIEVVTRPNTVLPGPPYPHFDVDGHWAFILEHLARFHATHGVSAISVTTHGAAAALLDRHGNLAAPILDYEYAGVEASAQAYDALRPPFSETGSPRIAAGLNLGAQLHWQLTTLPGLRDTLRHVVTYPQFWGYRLTRQLATDVTSLGCHTDLWNPFEGCFSALPQALGISDILAPPMTPADVLGRLTPQIAHTTGLAQTTPVRAGIHDSNASLLPHLLGRTPPFSVVSTGTWVIAMGVGATPKPLDPTRDTLVNVNALGNPVPSARFMGGREHDLALGPARVEADNRNIQAVLTDGVMLMPALAPETGPFAGSKAEWMGDEPRPGTGARTAAVGFYLALMTACCLDLIGHQGDVIIEGPFARNHPFLWMLEAATAARIVPMGSATGTSQGAALLVDGSKAPELTPLSLPDAPEGTHHLFKRYARIWHRAATQRWT